MIELGELDSAQERLETAMEKARDMDSQQARVELGEYQGQQGRIAKQRFVLSNNPDELARAIELYAARYRDNGRPYFHGINVVALVAAQERLDSSLPPPHDLQLPALAEAVLADLKRKIANGDDSQWPLATASEACLALNQCDDAELWLHRFLLHPQTHPFHIESYSRQLREIWRGNALRNTTCADRLSSIIDRHVMHTQKRWSISPEMVKTARSDPQSLEKNFSGERTFTVSTIQRMLEKCASIGCVTDTNGRRLGTGFLVAASSLGLGSDSELVFVTNAHVISDTVKDAIPTANAWVTFELESEAKCKPISHKVMPQVLFTSPPGDPGITAQDRLDVTVVKLESWPDGGLALRTNDSLPTPSRKSKVFVVGHPSGDALQISLHDSELLDVCDHDRLLHYRTPTEPGSSGSPVFNTNWEVVALHHAGSAAMPRLRGNGQYEANEGISIRSIRDGAALTSR
ncbi:MAG: hypothetical protein C4K60_18710 [Ideonella sp. MAG2]|nr:MAG: hypothetical protein C4K60_18710 [Ideonella sp. MAG2]